ncbi:MAG: NapC/NirT family cytochrome c [Verrucomicrobia bacterium]|nr:NapC/NirT family cytochrome c [Verrucomicrobiota bacterium]
MSTESNKPPSRASRFFLFRNWLSLTGLVIGLGSLFSFLLLFVLDVLAPFGNPYMGVLIYLVAPAVLLVGLLLAGLGALLEHRRVLKAVTAGQSAAALIIDLTRSRDRRLFGYFVGASLVFLLVAAMGSYHSYHFTESIQFCGQACHQVMGPQLTTYQNSPHARVRCTECHIGAGATWFVKAKISGLYQVYAVACNKYPRPIETPIKNLRPAQETCEQCHWPKKFVGNLDRTYQRFLSDEKNTPYAVRLLLKVGGGDPTHGPVGGIHWHMNVGNRMEYVTTDKEHQVVPWVRMIDSQGVITEFRTPEFKDKPETFGIRTMDCMDCHNRPAHNFQAPDVEVDLAMALGKIDRALPFVKKNCVAVLTQSYTAEAEAMQKIATTLSQKYPDDPRVRPVIDEVQRIYRQNFFPEMKVNWKVYHDNIGHRNWAGCFRCHDGQHKTADGKKTIKANDCNACHTILAQGSGAQLDQLTPRGQPFAHPGGDTGELKCHDCHTGGPP